MKEIKVYECEYCHKLFKTPNKHKCKFEPSLKNCFTCKNFIAWEEDNTLIDVGIRQVTAPPIVCCSKELEWSIEEIKEVNYNMQCQEWELKTTNNKRGNDLSTK